LLPPDELPKLEWSGEQQGGWIEDPSTGIWYGLTSSGTWPEAQASAIDMGGHLVMVRDFAHHDWLREKFGHERLWIGLQDAGEEALFGWSSGGGSEFRLWAWGQPDNFGLGQSHVYMNHNAFGDWNDAGLPEDPELALRGIVELPHPPGDFDGDGLSDDLERLLGTNLRDFDSDDDGVSDADEHAGWGAHGWKTNPALADSDGDGLWDGQEGGLRSGVRGNHLRNIAGTNLALFMPDSDPSSLTDPTLADSDLDGADDGSEDLNRNGRSDLGESDPLDSSDQGLRLSSSKWAQGGAVGLHVLGAEPRAELLVVASRRLMFGDAESGGLDVLLAPYMPLAMGRANAAGEAAWALPQLPEALSNEAALWIQLVEVGSDGTRRLTQPAQVWGKPQAIGYARH